MSYLGMILLIFVIILCSMVLHELAHGLVAYWLGDDTAKSEGRLTLNPLKHLDPVMSFAMPLFLFVTGGPIFGGAKPVPINAHKLKFGAWGMALVGLAGPLTNFLIAFITFVIWYFVAGAASTGLLGVICDYIVMINLGFGVFNLLPIPPLDGSRALYAIAPDGVRRVMAGMERYGMFIILGVVILLPNVISGIITGVINWILPIFFFLVGAR